MATYLEFEQNIRQIQEEIIAAEVRYDHHAVEILKQQLDKEVHKVQVELQSAKYCQTSHRNFAIA